MRDRKSSTSFRIGFDEETGVSLDYSMCTRLLRWMKDDGSMYYMQDFYLEAMAGPIETNLLTVRERLLKHILHHSQEAHERDGRPNVIKPRAMTLSTCCRSETGCLTSVLYQPQLLALAVQHKIMAFSATLVLPWAISTPPRTSNKRSFCPNNNNNI